jgi:hypothetical protein
VRNKQHDDYKVVPYPKPRRLLAVMLRALQRKPMMHFLLEIDVTRARQSIALQWYLFLPTFLFRFLYWMRGPHVLKKYGGTVVTAAVGMFEEGGRWAIPIGHPPFTHDDGQRWWINVTGKHVFRSIKIQRRLVSPGASIRVSPFKSLIVLWDYTWQFSGRVFPQ